MSDVGREVPEIGVEAALGVLVGADRGTALGAARRALEDWPDLGLLVAAAVAAARWGIDVVPAMARLAAGEALRGAISEYEARFGSEEALDELQGTVARLRVTSTAPERAGRRTLGAAATAVIGSAAAELDAAEAAVAGRSRWELTPGMTQPSLLRVTRLARALHVELVTHGDEEDGPHGRPDPPDVAPAYVGFGALGRP